MRDRNRRQPNRLHAAIRLDEAVQLRLHGAGLRRVEPARVVRPLDVLLDEETQLQRQAQSLVFEGHQACRQQFAVLGVAVGGGIVVGGVGGPPGYHARAPFRAQVVFRRVQDGD